MISLDDSPQNEFESSSPHKNEDITPCISGRFSFIEKYGDAMGTRKNVHYKLLKVVKGKKWFVEYYYRVPDNLRHKYPRVWERFKVYEDINRIKTDEYAQLLLASVKFGLENGYNPFLQGAKVMQDLQGSTKYKTWTAQQAVLYFKQQYTERGLAPESLGKYHQTIGRFIKWLELADLQHHKIASITEKHIESFLYHYKKQQGWSNRTFNNEKGLLSTIFRFLIKKKIITDNPCQAVDSLTYITKKHRFYHDALLEKVKKAMLNKNEYLHFAAEMVYNLCIRSEKELMHFKVGNIFPDTKRVFITAAGSKTRSDRYVPMTDEMLDSFRARGILDLPPDWFVMGKEGKPGPVRLGKRYLAGIFQELRKEIGMGSDYTLYGFKHTRIVHLKMAGTLDSDIMSLTGHADFNSYSAYLRDLGLTANPEELQKRSRKF